MVGGQKSSSLYGAGCITYYFMAPSNEHFGPICYSSGPRKDARPRLFHKLELRLSAGALGVKGHTFYRIKNSFWKVEGAGFETWFSVPKARAPPTHQSYADRFGQFFLTLRVSHGSQPQVTAKTAK